MNNSFLSNNSKNDLKIIYKLVITKKKSKKNIKNKSPLRYPGGKTRACKKLDSILEKNFKIEKFENLISPFLGGGSFEFFIQNKYNLLPKYNSKSFM